MALGHDVLPSEGPPKRGSQWTSRSRSTGTTYTNDVEPRLLLVHYIRDVLGLTGTTSVAIRPRAVRA